MVRDRGSTIPRSRLSDWQLKARIAGISTFVFLCESDAFRRENAMLSNGDRATVN